MSNYSIGLVLSIAIIIANQFSLKAQNIERNKPNIIIIKTDQHRFDLLGCMGNKVVKTPNIDRLASKSFILTNEFTVTPICTPSRTSFFTGKYVIRTGNVINNEQYHLQKLFNWTQNTSLEVEEYFKTTWQHLICNPIRVKNASESIVQDWGNFLNHIKPKACIISQYPSLVLKNNDLNELNVIAQEILYLLKILYKDTIESDFYVQKILDRNPHYDFPLIRDEVLKAKNWMVYRGV
jgi:hypothetical protein